MSSDWEIARLLQAQFDAEEEKELPAKEEESSSNIVDREWEDLDPTPDIHALFLGFNDRFFWGKLSACEVKWSPRMTLCAGICSYARRAGYCSIRLSVPLLKFRPRKDLVETLLHEMIHAYLFVTERDDDRDGHGPKFHEHMFRINREAGTNITVFHSFHNEVALYKQHWWKCDGPCVNRKPFYGLVKRSMNRAPGPNDTWWAEHQRTCGGAFSKIKEPEGYSQKKQKKKQKDEKQPDIKSFLGKQSNGGSNFPTKGKSGQVKNNNSSQVPSATATTSSTVSSPRKKTPSEVVRDFWSKKFDSSQSKKTEKLSDTKPIDIKTVTTSKNRNEGSVDSKPNNKKGILKENLTNSSEPQKNKRKNVFLDSDDDDDFQSSQQCPHCRKEILDEELAFHIDMCRYSK